jgi:predicted acetyltransferase
MLLVVSGSAALLTRDLCDGHQRQSLTVAWSIGLERVLATCDDDNVGSAKVIENCGGVLE